MKIFYVSIVTVLFCTMGYTQFGEQQIISTDEINPYISIPFDMDNDGDTDLLVAGDQGSLYWYDNTDGEGSFGSAIFINTNTVYYLEIELVDLDNDEDYDILYTQNNPRNIVWLENLDGQGNFGPEQYIIEEEITFVRNANTVDFDNDGDQDLILIYSDTFSDWISWHENLDNSNEFGPEIILIDDGNGLLDPVFVDMDGDSDLDLLTSHENHPPSKIGWYENSGNLDYGVFHEIYQFDTLLSDFISIYYLDYEDINSDGFKDIFITTYVDNEGIRVYWLENLVGTGEFGLPIYVPNMTSLYRLADIDYDNDLDLLLWDRYADTISWRENMDGLGDFSLERVISEAVISPRDCNLGDFDGDNFLDLTSVSNNDNKAAWYTYTGILHTEEFESSKLKIYPIPVNSVLKVSSKLPLKEVSIYDISGKKVIEFQDGQEIQLNGLTSGLYLGLFELQNGRVITKKIIKK